MRSATLLLFSVLSVFANEFAQANDDFWWGGFGDPTSPPGTNGFVYALAEHQGTIIVGGSFTQVGGQEASNIAKWDGATWQPLGSGLNGAVRDIAVVNDTLVVCGDFTSSGGSAVLHVAKWDGSIWKPLGTGINGPGFAVSSFQSNLVVAGDFSLAGTTPVSNIAIWDGSAWSDPGGGVDRPVLTLLSTGAHLYAGGEFLQAGTVLTDHVAVWDGFDWYRVGDDLYSAVNDIAEVDGTIFVASDDIIYQLSGTNWNLIGAGDNEVWALGTYEGSLVAAGQFQSISGRSGQRVMRWDGSQWHPIGFGIGCCAVYTVLPFGSHLYVGGEFLRDGISTDLNDVGFWDGSTWNGLASRGLDAECRALENTGTTVYLGGDFQVAGGRTVDYLAAWDGVTFTRPVSSLNGPVHAIEHRDGSVFVGGAFNSPYPSILEYSNDEVTDLGGGMNHNVYALSHFGDEVVAGGQFTMAGGVGANRVARWTGDSWASLGDGTSGPVFCLASTNDSLFVGGDFISAGGEAASYVAVWDGQEWHAMPGIDAPVRSLVVIDDVVYAGGDFAPHYLAAWIDGAWLPVDGGLDGPVHSLAEDEGTLVVGGAFSSAGGTPANNVVTWDGSEWSPLGAGSNGTVRCLALTSTSTLVGGSFTTCGSKPSYYFGQWNTAQSPDLQVVDIQWSPTPPLETTTAEIRVQVRNSGAGAASPATHEITFDGQQLCLVETGTLYGGQAVWTDPCSTWVLTEGEFDVTACADVFDSVPEEREDNNCRTEVLAPSSVTSLRITSGLSASVGESITIPVLLANTEEIREVQAGICYDQTKLQFLGFEPGGTISESDYVDRDWWSYSCPRFRTIFDYGCPSIPPGDWQVMGFRFLVREEADIGSTSISFDASQCYLRRCSGSTFQPYLIEADLTIEPRSPFVITSIEDVPNDQGRLARIRWDRVWHDQQNTGTTITAYSIYRRIDEILATTQDGYLYPEGDWEFVLEVPASGEEEYAALSPTLCDSTVQHGTCWSTFFIRAQTNDPLTYFDTAPDSGYSIDNLAPAVPENLHWDEEFPDMMVWSSLELPDFDFFSAFGATDSLFDASAVLLGNTIDPAFDVSDFQYPYYFVSATDFNGNRGEPATLQSSGPRTYVVRSDGTGDLATIQAAVDAAANSEIVLLEDGLFTGPGNRDINFGGKSVIVRSASNDPTSCIVDCGGSPSEPHRGFVFQSGEGQSSLVQGLTVRNGAAFGSGTDRFGGAVYCSNASPTIRNCILESNQAERNGGAISLFQSSILIEDCVIRGNQAPDGGGINSSSSSPEIVRTVVTGNHGANSGGGIRLFSQLDSRPVITQSTIASNRSNLGGGLLCASACSLEVSSTIIWENCSADGPSMRLDDPETFVSIACTDMDLGEVSIESGATLDTSSGDNLAADPILCTTLDCGSAPFVEGNYTLETQSPCLEGASPAGCGLIGALGEGCDATSDTPPTDALGGQLSLTCSPNPFTDRVVFQVYAPSGDVDVAIFDAAGKRVRTLVSGAEPGRIELDWDGRNSSGKQVASGIYFCRVRSSGSTETLRVVAVAR